MCGIMGYIGPRDAVPILIDGLSRLEYRGYDSAGVVVASDGRLAISKKQGKLAELVTVLDRDKPSGTAGIGHTRWATHGQPTDRNAHPHTDEEGRVAVVHNGIIENYLPLREELTARGHVLVSDTDTEVLAHLIEEEYEGDLAEAVRLAVGRATGAYALVAMAADEPERIVAVRKISPLVVGFGEGEMFLASDIPAVIDHTREVAIIEDGELVDVTRDRVEITTLDGAPVDRPRLHVDWDTGRAERGGYDHFMLKEIHEQPEVIQEALLGRVAGDGALQLDGVSLSVDDARALRRIWITGCGTALHAGLVGKDVLERVVRVPVEAAYAHELRYRDPLVRPGDLTVAISQSGETADTLEAARLVRDRGSRILALVNVVGSTLSREADDLLYVRAGPEIAVASTKAYLAMLVGQYVLAFHLAALRQTGEAAEIGRPLRELLDLPGQAAAVLAGEQHVAAVAESMAGADDVYFIGRGLDYAVAMEGSLKLKEISYIHSEAMPAGELKHGTLALVTDGTPVVVVVTQQHVYDKTISSLQEVKARGAHVIAVAYEDDVAIREHADEVLAIPRTDDLLSPVLAAIPLQLLAYHIARLRGHDIDQPRNLAKSVTVE